MGLLLRSRQAHRSRSPWHVLCPARSRLLFAGTGHLSLPWFTSIAALLFFSNFRLGATGYFDAQSDTKWLLHIGAFRWNGSSIWFIRSFSWDFTGSRGRDALSFRFLGLLQFCPFYCAFGFPKMIRLPYSICTAKSVGLLLASPKGVGIARGRIVALHSGIVSKNIPAFFLPVAFCS